jgi:two-component system, sensor histidine kinase and response regulator
VAQLRGDPGRLRQVLTNLINNAIKFTEHGEVAVKVSLESQTDKDVVLRFEIHDTGIGIPAKAQNRLFQPFSQTDGSTNRKYGGTGLGLAISKQLVEMMCGQIGVASTTGQGSTFWFTATLGRQPQGAKSLPMVRDNLVDLRVLIVDDNETNRQVLLHQTRAWKMRSTPIGGAAEALAELQSAQVAGDPYQLILLDLQMPGTDGLALAKSIRAKSALAGVRIVLLVSMRRRLNPEELKVAGIDDYLEKPIKQSLLFDCLATLIGNVAPAATGFVKKASHAPASQKLRILLAEDNIVNQEVAQGLLRKLGWRTDTVANGNEVLEAVGHIPYDVVLMDCQMPELDGYETTRRIRQSERKGIKPFDRGKPIHIIAMTANAMQGDMEKCLAAGMNDYLTKPVRTADLKAALNKIGGRRFSLSNPALVEPVTSPASARL